MGMMSGITEIMTTECSTIWLFLFVERCDVLMTKLQATTAAVEMQKSERGHVNVIFTLAFYVPAPSYTTGSSKVLLDMYIKTIHVYSYISKEYCLYSSASCGHFA